MSYQIVAISNERGPPEQAYNKLERAAAGSNANYAGEEECLNLDGWDPNFGASFFVIDFILDQISSTVTRYTSVCNHLDASPPIFNQWDMHRCIDIPIQSLGHHPVPLCRFDGCFAFDAENVHVTHSASSRNNLSPLFVSPLPQKCSSLMFHP